VSVNFSASLTTRLYNWTDWLVVATSHKFAIQYEDDIDTYTIWGYDGPEVHICTIWQGTVPDAAITGGYSQAQNDADLADWETNYKPTANAPIDPRAATGVQGVAAAKGLGNFAPDPRNNPYEPAPDEVSQLYVDTEGSLVTRGAVLTDEGSLRDDFVGSALETTLTGSLTFTNGSRDVTGTGTLFTEEVNRNHYIKLSADGIDKFVAIVRAPTDTSLLLEEPYAGSSATGAAQITRWLKVPIGGTPGTVAVGSSSLTLTGSTVNACGLHVYRSGDYLPMLATWQVSISQRVANQTAWFGFRDSSTSPTMYCDVVFDGTANTTFKFRSAWNGDEQLSTITLP